MPDLNLPHHPSVDAIAQQAFGAALARIEAKLDALLKALADEEDDTEQRMDLDGKMVGGPRDGSKSL